MRNIYDYIAAKYGEGGYAQEEVDLSDFCDSYPISVESMYADIYYQDGETFGRETPGARSESL